MNQAPTTTTPAQLGALPPSPEPSATGEIYTALPAVMADVGAIGKDRANDQQRYYFRGIDDIYNAVQPALVKHRVTVIPVAMAIGKREERPNKRGDGVLTFTMIRARYRITAADGSHVYCEALGEGMDSADKSTNKAMSAAQKYAILQTLCIPTAEAKDSENDHPEPGQRGNQQPANRQGNNAPSRQQQQPQRQQQGGRQQQPQRGNPPPQGRSGPSGGKRLPDKPPMGQLVQQLRRAWAEKFNDGEIDVERFSAFCARELGQEPGNADFNKVSAWDDQSYGRVSASLKAGGQ